MAAARTSRDRNLDALFVQKGKLEGELVFLHRQAKAVGVLEQLRAQIARLESEVAKLEAEIKQHMRAQEKRGRLASETIQRLAIGLLKSDLDREDAFREAKSVSVDFGRNVIAVDGRNQFSASSLCYLKNCIHYAILFASLEFEFFRYPRFIICDNMEDKGMEEVRSRNFQRSIVDLSEKQETEHQIIFTTSMIDPGLEDSAMCVGQHYTSERKTLAF